MNVCQSRHDRLEHDLRFFHPLGVNRLRQLAPEISVPHGDNGCHLRDGFQRVHAGLRQRGNRAADQIVAPYLLASRVAAGQKPRTAPSAEV